MKEQTTVSSCVADKCPVCGETMKEGQRLVAFKEFKKGNATTGEVSKELLRLHRACLDNINSLITYLAIRKLTAYPIFWEGSRPYYQRRGEDPTCLYDVDQEELSKDHSFWAFEIVINDNTGIHLSSPILSVTETDPATGEIIERKYYASVAYFYEDEKD